MIGLEDGCVAFTSHRVKKKRWENYPGKQRIDGGVSHKGSKKAKKWCMYSLCLDSKFKTGSVLCLKDKELALCTWFHY